ELLCRSGRHRARAGHFPAGAAGDPGHHRTGERGRSLPRTNRRAHPACHRAKSGVIAPVRLIVITGAASLKAAVLTRPACQAEYSGPGHGPSPGGRTTSAAASVNAAPRRSLSTKSGSPAPRHACHPPPLRVQRAEILRTAASLLSPRLQPDTGPHAVHHVAFPTLSGSPGFWSVVCVRVQRPLTFG